MTIEDFQDTLEGALELDKGLDSKITLDLIMEGIDEFPDYYEENSEHIDWIIESLTNDCVITDGDLFKSNKGVILRIGKNNDLSYSEEDINYLDETQEMVELLQEESEDPEISMHDKIQSRCWEQLDKYSGDYDKRMESMKGFVYFRTQDGKIIKVQEGESVLLNDCGNGYMFGSAIADELQDGLEIGDKIEYCDAVKYIEKMQKEKQSQAQEDSDLDD